MVILAPCAVYSKEHAVVENDSKNDGAQKAAAQKSRAARVLLRIHKVT